MSSGSSVAVDDACPHAGWSLAYGCLEGRRLICSLHRWGFDVFTGECVLFDGKLASHPVRVEDGILEVFLRVRSNADRRAVGELDV